MNYIQTVTAKLAHLGCDESLTGLYALLVLVKGEQTTLKDVHEAWAVWRNASNPAHRSLIPFEELTVEVQELDRKYMEAIHEAARS